jgi:hypothetical protein
MAVTARSTLKKDKTHPTNPETMNGILITWQRYDRVSDNLWLLGDPEWHSERPEPEPSGDEMPPIIPDFGTSPRGK